MSVVLAISAACLALVLFLAGRRRRPTRAERAAPAVEGVASRMGERCLLCNGPLPSQLVTREEVIARVERRIDVDSAAVAVLLASPPSAAWLSLFRP